MNAQRATLPRLIAIAVLASAGALPAQAQDAGQWLVRARAVNLDSANKDGTGLGLTINDKTLPEVDISYFFTPNLAAELVLTVPQAQKVRSNGAAIGTFKHLPPTLMLQYHVTGLGLLRPYVGAGVNYTNISSVGFSPAVQAALGGSINLKRNSVGLAIQAGVDVPLGGGWLLNLDVKKVQIGTDVKLNGAKVGGFDVDPLLVGVGLGKRF